MKKPLPTLAELRRQIDKIDDQLHRLLRERADIVHTVRAVKGKQAIFIRPGREASMVRDLVRRSAGRIPPGLVMRLWREMIGAFTMQEGRLSVAVTCGKGDADLWDISRDFYGSSTPLVSCATPLKALAHVRRGQTEIAVLPLPQDKQATPWWAVLAREPDLQVFAQFPFDLADAAHCNWRGNRLGAWAVARLAPEPTGDDHGLLLVWGGKPSQSKAVQALLHRLRPLALHGDASRVVWLVTVKGLVDLMDKNLRSVTDDLAALGVSMRCIGGYAVPMG